uniref:Serine/threonine-protein phosphatase 4 regulatory subunit 3-like central domain-containing protein n=1 Tax=Kalanchoe fedtschenkoi TaxID=63787 RepID=A0A7N0TSU7_KALFE
MFVIFPQQHFFTKLMDDFKTAEGLRSNDALARIYRILKATISFNSSLILEKILSDDLLMDDIIDVWNTFLSFRVLNVLGIFCKIPVFEEASPIDCSDMLSKMRKSSRKVFRKDKKSGRAICHSINIIGVSFLKKDDNAFIQKLLAKIKLATTSAEASAMLNFLGEICTLSLPVDHKKGLFRDLINEGIFDVVTTALQSEDKEVALKGY